MSTNPIERFYNSANKSKEGKTSVKLASGIVLKREGAPKDDSDNSLLEHMNKEGVKGQHKVQIANGENTKNVSSPIVGEDIQYFAECAVFGAEEAGKRWMQRKESEQRKAEEQYAADMNAAQFHAALIRMEASKDLNVLLHDQAVCSACIEKGYQPTEAELELLALVARKARAIEEKQSKKSK